MVLDKETKGETMKIKMLSVSLLLAVLASSSDGVVPAKQSKVVELLSKEGGSKIAIRKAKRMRSASRTACCTS